jgi:hypothetical protein
MRMPHFVGLAMPCALLALAATQPAAASTQVHASTPTPSGMETPTASTPGHERLQDAVASVVVVALTEQFDGTPVAVNIESYDVSVSGARERTVTGRGRVDLEGASEPIVFQYRTLYDVLSANAGYPTISIGSLGGGSERSVPNDAGLIGELDQRVAAALSQELGGRRVWLQLDTIESFESAQRYVRIHAAGLADFGLDGSTPARVEGLYDRGRNAWLRVNYELGGPVPMSGG